MAAGQLQRQAKRFHDIMRYASSTEGAKVFRTVVAEFAHKGDSGVNLPHIQPEIGIPLIVLQQNIILRHIPLNQRAFQHQRLKFRCGDNHIKMMDLTHHDAGLRRMGRGILKILADTVFQLFGLADVYYLVCLIPHDIHAGGIWQAKRFFLQLVKRHSESPPISLPCRM